uniref:E3 ubiquitin-protein ligase listerin n=2 Tax=Parascaris univalens TaxID=6257 RepID=A0A915B115_PARUN
MSKQQRRKGSAKTASSAQAAELLSSSGHLMGFIGFDGCGNLPAYLMENIDVSHDGITAEIRNALKKMTKKDAFTREKGLKEMISLLESVEVEQIEKCFPLYASSFPKLSLDGVLIVRTNSIRLLESFIKVLKKNSERYMKTVLPYVIFAMYDSYTQVVQFANSLLMNCFAEENRRKAIALCVQPTCNIVLQILDRTHPLLLKGEGEETENQRECRLSTQSLVCLTTLCERLDSTSEKERIMKIMLNKHLFKHLINLSPQVMNGMFSLGLHLITLEWANEILQSGLPISALTNLDNSNGLVV